MGDQAFTIDVRGPFSLAAGIRFLEGFTPADYEPDDEHHLDIAFCAEPGWEPLAVRVQQRGDTVHGSVVGNAATERVAAHIARILSVDVDGSAFPAVGTRDPVVAGLQDKYPGLRPVCFWSPYEAAAWAVIGHRIRIRQAARIKAEMSRQLGQRVEFHAQTLHAFPGPGRLLDLESFPGLSGRKPEWLRGIAHAALDGQLDPDLLRGMPGDDAIAHLQQLGGIGPFSAELILLRGAGEPDRAPRNEPRFARAVQLAYQLEETPTAEQLDAITDRWAPYRTWVTLLLRANLEDSTHEIGGRPRPATGT